MGGSLGLTRVPSVYTWSRIQLSMLRPLTGLLPTTMSFLPLHFIQLYCSSQTSMNIKKWNVLWTVYIYMHVMCGCKYILFHPNMIFTVCKKKSSTYLEMCYEQCICVLCVIVNTFCLTPMWSSQLTGCKEKSSTYLSIYPVLIVEWHVANLLSFDPCLAVLDIIMLCLYFTS